MTKTILVATGQSSIDNFVKKFKEFEFLTSVNKKDDLYSTCKEYRPEVVLISEGLSGDKPLKDIALDIKRLLPNARIIYLAGGVNPKDKKRMSELASLASEGIYDIIYTKKITGAMLKDALLNPKDERHVEVFIKFLSQSKPIREAQKEILNNGNEDYIDDRGVHANDDVEDESIIKNVYVMSSIKPGTGKSFLSVNVATAIAQYGVNNKDGHRPRVALIEADLQNLSIGTLLQIEDPKRNIKTVMDKLSLIISDDGRYIGDEHIYKEVERFILNAFMPYYRTKNLRALVGSQLSIGELGGITPFHYPYLLSMIAPHFDVIIVDTNSALTHVTSQPILSLAKSCYYILNLDFNNVRNNTRYRETLKDIGVLDKIKYVLNEDIRTDTKSGFMGTDEEALIFTSQHLEDSGFKLEARIPVIPKAVFLNRLYEGTPIVLDDKKSNKEVKFELLKVANQIYPIKKFAEMEDEMTGGSKKKKGLFK